MASVLIVDDEKSFRETLRDILESAGHEVREAGNGLEAIESYKSNPSDIVIMDIIMPEKEGIETIIELRRNYPDIKLIAVSGFGEESPHLMMAKHLGADFILEKPFSLEDILSKVQLLLEK